MIFSPAVIALITGSLLVGGFALYASAVGLRILHHWDIRSGSELQLALERKTYLISTIFGCLLIFELFSLFLFVHTADNIHEQFIGAMCAAGSLNVNGYGYPTLILKTTVFILCGIWLVLNHTDNQGEDYPLILKKYRFLLTITALLVLELYFQFRYFREMQPNLITSCCGTIFNEDTAGLAGDAVAVPPTAAAVIFFTTVALALRMGLYFLTTGRAGTWFAWINGWLFLFSFIAVVSFISVYFYELPTHHCPFCILQPEYHAIGYFLYLFLFVGGITGVSVGILDRMKGPRSLAAVIPGVQKRLCIVSLTASVLFTIIALYPMIFSDFVLIGY